MRKFYMLALMAGSLGLAPQRAQAQAPATWQEHWFEHSQVVSSMFPCAVKPGEHDATTPLNISLLDVNRTAVVYKKANACDVSISTGNVAGGIYVLVVTNGKKYYTRKIVIQ
ncbi:T9SS type A sorting domain-containing protein [Chitinophaga filiformis]|uniref:Por secretion system C-terminal sorting domain-containing protein n=1 Tax=Chitinophaga filiformis TaxID=104663 RepID=A0A1G7RZA2_CHIFI|nr:T9SS type A sorting domain-containing protein [Chitinophaga filiformis]SDG16061.1 Por secretion system C-terminal sorting domain-containing protein [Chitinophaga filiformis]